MNDRKSNLEFKITFSETNLRWLYGEPQSESRDKKIDFNKKEIEKAKIELEKIK